MVARARMTLATPPVEPVVDERPEALIIGDRIKSRAQAMKISLSRLSRECGKAEGYLSMFITKGAPEKLPAEVRIVLSRMLEIPESLLRTSSQMAISKPVETTHNHSSAADIPVFREGQEIDPERAAEWVARPPNHSGSTGGMFALWISRDRDRVRTGDLVYVTPQPARAGDMAVILHNKVVLAVGELYRTNSSTLAVVSADRVQLIDLNDQILKVGSITLA